jgi:hypothetical protein
MRKALFAAVCATALGLGGSALAQEAGNITNGGLGANVQGFNQTDDSTNVDFTSDGSFNDSSDNSQNTTVDIDDTLNDNSDNSNNTTVDINDTLNDNSDNSNNLTADIGDSFNDNSVTRTSTNTQVLAGVVGPATMTFTGGGADGNTGDFVSGNSRVDTSGSFAGVQNGGSNTGFAANALVANGISANANISFGE